MEHARPPVPSLAAAVLLALLAAPADAGVHKMFVTSAIGSAKLSTWAESLGLVGLAGGDQICQTLAFNAGLENSGEFRAWLSTTATDAYCHVAGFDGKRGANCGQAALPTAGPWVRVDGQAFGRQLKAITGNDGTILHTPEVDEHGNSLDSAFVYTGSDPDGVVSTTCVNWTSDVDASSGEDGRTNYGTAWWTDFGSIGCSATIHLYCFEQGAGDPLPPFQRPGGLVFVTSSVGTGNLGSWPEAGGATGLAAGDAICRKLAADAGLEVPDSYVAWLSTNSVDAIDRLPSGLAFRRLGGVQIAADKSGLLGTSDAARTLQSDVEVDEQKTHRYGSAFTGTDVQGHHVPGNACNGWTSASTSADVTKGIVNSDAGSWTAFVDPSKCSVPGHLYCFSTVSSLLDDGFESGDATVWAEVTP